MATDTIGGIKRQDERDAKDGPAQRAYDNASLLGGMLTGLKYIDPDATQTEIQAALTAVGTNGGVVNFDPRGVHDLTSALTLTIAVNKPVVINFNGARIRRSGAHGAFDVLEAVGNPGAMFSNCTINDLRIDDAGGTSTATYGLKVDCKRATFNKFHDATDTTHGSYRAVWMGQTSYWNSFYDPWIRRHASGVMAGSTGFYCDGYSNALHIYGGAITKVENGILFYNNGGFANGCSFHGVTFEEVTYGVVWDSATSTTMAGVINNPFIGCRFELMDAAFKTTANIDGHSVTRLGNYYVSNVTAIDDFANDPAHELALDAGHSGVGFQHAIQCANGLLVQSLQGAAQPLEVSPGGGNRGIQLNNVQRTSSLQIKAVSETEYETVVADGFSSKHYLGNVGGLCENARRSVNFVGEVTISGTATTASVVFAATQLNALYRVYLTTRVDSGTPAVSAAVASNRSTTGFDIELTAAPGTGESIVVQWMIVGR